MHEQDRARLRSRSSPKMDLSSSGGGKSARFDLLRLFPVCVAFTACPAPAKVVSAQAAGFEVQEDVHIAATPKRVWEALEHVEFWWSKEHTLSGDARNLSMDLAPGGCFCERSAKGSVRYMEVQTAVPGRMLRLDGALGPLSGLGAAGHLTFILKPVGDGTDLTVTYRVGGWSADGLDKFAADLDGVLAEQWARLASVSAAMPR